MNNSKLRKNNRDKFFDNLAQYFNPENKQDLTSVAVGKLTKEIENLNKAIRKADESSTKLSKALNRLTFWAVIIAGSGVIIAALNFIFQYLIRK